MTIEDGADIHNPGVDEQVVGTGACGRVHLASGRTCTLRHRHRGQCDFVTAAEVADSIARRRSAGDW